MSEEFGKIIRAARGLLGWHQADLAKHAKVSTPTIWAIETGRTVGKAKKGEGRVPNEITIDALKAALEEGGVGFTEKIKGVKGPGVYLKWREDMDDDTETLGAPIDAVGRHSPVAVELAEDLEVVEGDKNS